MPTYDYQCRACGAVTEVIHSMLDAGPSACEECGGELRRVLYPTGIIFKGSGFYRNDSRATVAAAGSSGSESPKSEPSAPSQSSAADAKPAAAKGDAASKGPSNAKKTTQESS